MRPLQGRPIRDIWHLKFYGKWFFSKYQSSVLLALRKGNHDDIERVVMSWRRHVVYQFHYTNSRRSHAPIFWSWFGNVSPSVLKYAIKKKNEAQWNANCVQLTTDKYWNWLGHVYVVYESITSILNQYILILVLHICVIQGSILSQIIFHNFKCQISVGYTL